MQNKSVNKGIFHFWGGRIWAPVSVYQYENCSGYVTDNMCNLFHDVIIMPFLTSNFLLKFEYCKNQKSSFKGFILLKCKKLGDTSFKYEQKWKAILSFLAELEFSRSS